MDGENRNLVRISLFLFVALIVGMASTASSHARSRALSRRADDNANVEQQSRKMNLMSKSLDADIRRVGNPVSIPLSPARANHKKRMPGTHFDGVPTPPQIPVASGDREAPSNRLRTSIDQKPKTNPDTLASREKAETHSTLPNQASPIVKGEA